MLISPAYAQAAGGMPGFDPPFLIMMVLLFGIFYLFLIRPQQKKMKQHREMLGAIKRGDRIVTGGGIIGRVARIEGDDELIVEIAPEVRVRVSRATVADLKARGEPAKGDGKGADKGAAEASSKKKG